MALFVFVDISQSLPFFYFLCHTIRIVLVVFSFIFDFQIAACPSKNLVKEELKSLKVSKVSVGMCIPFCKILKASLYYLQLHHVREKQICFVRFKYSCSVRGCK